jgi:hypothetical protein
MAYSSDFEKLSVIVLPLAQDTIKEGELFLNDAMRWYRIIWRGRYTKSQRTDPDRTFMQMMP